MIWRTLNKLSALGRFLNKYRGAAAASATVLAILGFSVGYRPNFAVSVPERYIPFTSNMINKDGMVFTVRREGLDYLGNILGPSLDTPDMYQYLADAILGLDPLSDTCTSGQHVIVTAEDGVDGTPIDGKVLYYDTVATEPYGRQNNYNNKAPTAVLWVYTGDHGGLGHPNEPHIDAYVTLYDVVMELRVKTFSTLCLLGCCNQGDTGCCSLCNSATIAKLDTFPLRLVIDPQKIDVNNVGSRADDPVISIDVPTVDITPTGTIVACGLTLDWGCVAPLIEPMLEPILASTIQSQVRGLLPMDLNGMFASEPAYSCPTYSGTDNNPWCKCGVQTDPMLDGFGYCNDCDLDGMIAGPTDLYEPAYKANLGETPPTTYGTLSCGEALIDIGAYPHLSIVTTGEGSPSDRMTMNTDFACDVDTPAPDIVPGRINAQAKLCCCGEGGCATCVGNPPGNTPCCPAAGSCRPTPPGSPDYNNDSIPDNNMFSCSIGQDAGNQIASAIVQSGLISCEINENGFSSGFPLPLPLPIDMQALLKVESFAGLVPPIDDFADPGTYVTIRWRPYGDDNPATSEICAAIGAEPGPEFQEKGCSALIATGATDINYSFRNIYTDFFIEEGGQMEKAFGIRGDVGGAVDLEFKTALEPDRNFGSKAAFLAAGCNPLAGSNGCLKLTLDPIDLKINDFVYFNFPVGSCPVFDPLDPDCYRLDNALMAEALPDVLINLVGGAINLWVETQITLAGLGINAFFAGPDRYAPDLDGNSKGDFLTCAGNFTGTFDLALLLDSLSSSSTEDPCAIENLKAAARMMASRAAEEKMAAARRPPPAGGPETYIIHPRSGKAVTQLQLNAVEARDARLLPLNSRVGVEAVGSGKSTYTYRLDNGLYRASKEPYLELPFLLEGTHLLEVQAVDETGLPDPTPARMKFTVDSVPPKIRIHGVTPKGIAADGTMVFEADPTSVLVQVSDYQNEFKDLQAFYWLDGSPQTPITASETRVDLSRLDAGKSHMLSVHAIDPSGQESRVVRTLKIRPTADESGGGSGFFGCVQVP
ncbi:MAG: hypothetical protein HYY13_08425 [Nitrospirae bacterium]|nr:hypothetical protein [Nitrospirota bacterium]